MGSDGHHRRTAGDRASYCLTMDIVGPMPVGDDVGTGEKSKYMMVSTIAIPRIPMEGDPKGPADVEEDDTLPKLEAEEDEPVEKATDDEVKTLNQKWMDHVKDLAEPVGVQNLTLVEPLRSRHREDVIKVASKLYCRYRAMGVAPLRIHTDRETSFLSRQFQAWCQRMGLYQTMTGGDEGPSNGRIESEVQQVKRRLRLLVKESGLGEKHWPGIARWIGQERLVAGGWRPCQAVVADWSPGHGQDETVASSRLWSSGSPFSHYDVDGPFTFDEHWIRFDGWYPGATFQVGYSNRPKCRSGCVGASSCGRPWKTRQTSPWKTATGSTTPSSTSTSSTP